MTQLENIPVQEENVNITLSIPVSELSGLVPVDYKKITKEVLNEIDMEFLASNVRENIDMDDFASDVKDCIDMSDLASDVKDCFDMSDLANDVKDYIKEDRESVEDQINDLMERYDVLSDCHTSKQATKIIINAIRYDIMNHLNDSDEYDLDSTMTGTLRRFIQKVITKNNEETARNNETFTFGQVVDILDSMPGLDFNTKFQIRNALTNVLYNKKVSSVDVIIKAD